VFDGWGGAVTGATGAGDAVSAGASTPPPDGAHAGPAGEPAPPA
jgi:hypothetical protein